MKALKLGSLAALFFFMVASCTKDTKSLSTSDNAARTTLLSGNKGGGAQTQGNNKETPSVLISFSPEIGVKGEPLTVTGAFDLSAPVPDCGHLQLEWLVNGEWEAAGEKAKVTVDNKTVSFTFTPEIVGDAAYSFRLHYVASGTPGEGQCAFNQVMSNVYTLKVIEPCVSVFTVKGGVTAAPVTGKPGVYEFTVTYTLTSPEDVNGVSFQGGATAGGHTNHDVIEESFTEGLSVRHYNNNNTVLVWNGDLKACQAKTVQFKYQRNFSCPATNELVTGEWSASANGTDLGSIGKLPYSCN